MMFCRIVFTVWLTLSLGISMAKHGEPSGRYNFWTYLISAVLQVLLLWGGGFYG